MPSSSYFCAIEPVYQTLKLLYHIFIALYRLSIGLAAPWNKKAKAWIKGRRNLFEELEQKILPSDRIIWMHCASAGEFEQGKPVLEALKAQYPQHKALVSFFSPSGYETGKKYKGADFICYLPLDTKANADRFLSLAKPE